MTSFDNLSFIAIMLKEFNLLKKRLKLIEHFKSKKRHTEYCFFRKLSPVVMTNKNGDTILAATPSFHTAKETHAAF